MLVFLNLVWSHRVHVKYFQKSCLTGCFELSDLCFVVYIFRLCPKLQYLRYISLSFDYKLWFII